jgi:CheY-like chemotaxis protein
VVVVEDNPAEAALIGEAFASISIPVDLECLTTGARALQRLRQDAAGRRPTLVLLDNHLPDMRGTELAAKLAEDDAYGHPRVVLLSGDPPRGLVGPWEDWLVKPESWDGWEHLARQLLQRFLVGGAR